jgi:hypothetical protein
MRLVRYVLLAASIGGIATAEQLLERYPRWLTQRLGFVTFEPDGVSKWGVYFVSTTCLLFVLTMWRDVYYWRARRTDGQVQCLRRAAVLIVPIAWVVVMPLLPGRLIK